MENCSGRLGIEGRYEASMIVTLSNTEGTKWMFKKEVKIIVKLVVIEEANESKWGATSFDQPNAKTNWVILLSDFRKLNRQLKRKP